MANMGWAVTVDAEPGKEEDGQMNQAKDFSKKLVFRLRWVVMSQEGRYAWLLARTQRAMGRDRLEEVSE
jgi:hypothetical protein